MASKNIDKYWALKKTAKMMLWTVGIAVLWLLLEICFGFEGTGRAMITSGMKGALLGAIVGGISDKILTRWTDGAIVGAAIGAGGAIVWLVAIQLGFVFTLDGPIPLFTRSILFIFFKTLGYAFIGAIGGIIAESSK